MKKTFSFEVPGLKPPRVVDSIKSELRRYVKRERKKKLPEGVDFWDFDCRAGADAGSAVDTHVTKLNEAVDAAAAESRPSIYIEILAKPGIRKKKDEPAPPARDDA